MVCDIIFHMTRWVLAGASVLGVCLPQASTPLVRYGALPKLIAFIFIGEILKNIVTVH